MGKIRKTLKEALEGERSYFVARDSAERLVRELPDSSIDAIITDPPYNLGAYSTGNIKLDWRKDFNNDVAAWDQGQFDPRVWADEFNRVLKPTGNIFAFTSYNLLGAWHSTFDDLFDTFQFMVWHKTNPPPKFRKAGFLNSCELIVCMWNRGHKWNFGKQNEMHNFIEAPICMGNERLKDPHHPTQKPLRVLSRLVELGTENGDVILDPFMGVGSTGVSAVSAARRFIGCDVDPDFATAARKRLRETQLSLVA